VRPADFVLVFTLTEEAAVARLIKRGETSGRADDNEETIRSRMAVFATDSQPVIDELKGTGRVAEIDSQGSVDDVYGSVRQAIARIEGVSLPAPPAKLPEQGSLDASALKAPVPPTSGADPASRSPLHARLAANSSIGKSVPASATADTTLASAAASSLLPVRSYMDATVVPALRNALRSLNTARPSDPLGFLAAQLLEARDSAAAGVL
jgi:hypothetical protein